MSFQKSSFLDNTFAPSDNSRSLVSENQDGRLGTTAHGSITRMVGDVGAAPNTAPMDYDEPIDSTMASYPVGYAGGIMAMNTTQVIGLVAIAAALGFLIAKNI